MLKITLFGTPQITLDDKSLSEHITGRKLSLLVYLVTTGRPHSRDVLADLLWSNTTNRRARKHLRDTLPTLRRYLGKYVITQGDTIAFNSKLSYWLDVEVFGTYVGSETIRSNLNMLHKVLDLYQADFLHGFYIRNAPTFELWLEQKRTQLQKQALEGLFFLANRYFIEKNDKAALQVNTRLLTLEPWREDAHQLQMKLLVEDGQRHAALEQYARCCKILAEQYQIEPLFETTRLYQQIKLHHSKQVHQNHVNGYDNALSPSLSSQAVVNWDAMPPITSFYGREEELSQLEALLLKPSCRLVSIYGMVGQGKSTLVANLVEKLASAEAQIASPSPPFHYILWYSLIDQPTVSQLLHFFLQNLLPPERNIPETMTEQCALLVKCLQDQRCLLVLDHVEQIMPTGKDSVKLAHEYDLYNELWRRVAQNAHQSTLILISRIEPHEIARLNRYSERVQTICLGGLCAQTSMTMLRQTNWQADEPEMKAWLNMYSGNPLALTLLKETIQDLPSDEIDFFLSDGPMLFEALADRLEQQITTLSSVEYDLLLWLTVINKPVTLKTLWYQLIDPHPKQTYLAAQRTLQRYGFLQHEVGQIRLNSLLRFYLSHHLAKVITDELVTYQETDSVLDLFSRYLAQEKQDSSPNVSAFKKWKNEQSTSLSNLKRYSLSFNHSETKETPITSNVSVLPLVLSQLVSKWGIDECAEKLRALLVKEQKKEHKERNYLEQNFNYLLSFLMFIRAQKSSHKKKSNLAYISQQ